MHVKVWHLVLYRIPTKPVYVSAILFAGRYTSFGHHYYLRELKLVCRVVHVHLGVAYMHWCVRSDVTASAAAADAVASTPLTFADAVTKAQLEP